MPSFDITFSDGGRRIRRRVQANDAASAAIAAGLPSARILALDAVREAAPARGALRRFPLRLFSQELAVLLEAGIPLLEAVVTLREKESARAAAAVLDALAESLRQGEAFSAAMRRRGDAFDALIVAVVGAAERSGQLAAALRGHAAYLAWVETLGHRLLAALVYPLLLVVASLAVVLFLLVFVVPRFAGILDGLGSALPTGSRGLLAVSAFVTTHPELVLLGAAGTAAALVLAWRQGALPAALSRVAWQLPLLGPKLRLLGLARFFRTVSMLLEAGVPALPALQHARAVIAARFGPALDQAAAAVGRGVALSSALDDAGLATPVSSRMVRVGERSGSLGAMLGQAARFYDEELERLGDLVTRLVNPLVMLLMGALIGSVVVLMYLPIFQLAEQVQ